MDRDERMVPLAAAISAASRLVDRSSKIRIDWPSRAWWVKVFFVWLALQGLVVILVRLAGAEIGELPPAPPPDPLSEPQQNALAMAVIGLGLAALAIALGEVAEATVAVTAGVAVGAGALVTGITLGAVAVVVAVAVATVVVSAVVVAPALNAALRARGTPQSGPSITTGEQTDAMQQAIQQAAELEANPQSSLSVRFSLAGRGLDLDDPEIDQALLDAVSNPSGITIGDVPGSPPGSVPGTGLTIGLSPVDTATPGESGPPSSPSDPAPGPGIDGIGLFMVAGPGLDIVNQSPVPTMRTLWMLLLGGAGWMVVRRRYA
jgi:hypothetical protein